MAASVLSKDAVGGSIGIPHGVKHEEFFSEELPKKVIFRLMKEYLPNRVMIGEDAKKAIMHSLPIFIAYITHAARDVMEGKGHTSIGEEHVLSALEDILGLEGFIPDLKTSLQEYKLSGPKTKPKKKLEGVENAPGAPGEAADGEDEDEDYAEDDEDDGEDGAVHGAATVSPSSVEKPHLPMKLKFVMSKIGQGVVTSGVAVTVASPSSVAQDGRIPHVSDTTMDGSSALSSVGSLGDSDGEGLGESGSGGRSKNGDSSSIGMDLKEADRRLGGDPDDTFD
ncbi:DNA polymerase epsilon subunit 3 [Gonapodya sp. JEL0774]|nr:DNA polymerase epsilon subunit 3 [Gonapodya sp. JEL0774]